MKMSLTTKVTILFGLLGVIVLINFKLLFDAELKKNEQQNWVLHTHEVIQESERLLGSLRDAETGQRGFILTLNDSYLEPFSEGVTKTQTQLSLVRKLTEDNLDQQVLLSHIENLIFKKISELEKTVKLSQQGRSEEAIKIVNSDFGKNVMDSIRKNINKLISVEEALLVQRKEEYLHQKSNLITLFYVEFSFLALLIIFACFYIQKTIARPIKTMANHITSAGEDLDGTRAEFKPRNDEIGTLEEEFNKMVRKIQDQTNKKDNLIAELKTALDEIKTLKGIIPICSYCHKIRDDEGAWSRLEAYLEDHSEAAFSHGICDQCMEDKFEKYKKDQK
jgi:CHASE3 domain sensor protein